MKEPELVTATQEELDEILRHAKPALSDQQFRLLEGVLATFVYVMLKLLWAPVRTCMNSAGLKVLLAKQWWLSCGR